MRHLFASLAAFVLVTGCAKSREEQKPTPAPTSTAAAAPTTSVGAKAGPATGAAPKTLCRYESATATSSMEIADVIALDISQQESRVVVACSGGSIQDCAGTIAEKHDPVKGDATFKLVADQRGQVSDVTVETNHGLPPDVTTCASTILKKLDLPDGDKTQTNVRVTLRYAPQAPGSSPRFAGIDLQPHTQVTAGGLPGADKAVSAQLGKMRGCYLIGLEGDDTLAGTINFTLQVGGTGQITDAKIEQRGNLTPAVLDCANLVMHVPSFGAPDGGKGTVTGSWDLTRKRP